MTRIAQDMQQYTLIFKLKPLQAYQPICDKPEDSTWLLN